VKLAQQFAHRSGDRYQRAWTAQAPRKYESIVLLARLLRRPDRRPGAAGAAVSCGRHRAAGLRRHPDTEEAPCRDGGTSWTRQSIPPGVACNGDCQSGLYGYPLEWVSCLSSGLCRAGGGVLLDCGHCGFAYAVLVTRGPGQPWACAQSAAACADVAPDAADCSASTGCYGVQSTNPFGGPNGGVNVFRSANGGASWTQIGPVQGWSSSVLNAITCPAALTCYLAGSHGSIARITNGTTLTAQRTPTTRDLYGIGCAGPGPGPTCYAVGDNGTVLALG
jgi:hypothetical protein